MFDLERVWLVASREWFSRLRQRSFQITTLVQLIIVIIGASIPTIAAAFSDDDNADNVTVVVLDETGGTLIGPIGERLSIDNPGQSHISVRPFSGTTDELRATVDDGDSDVGLAISRTSSGSLAFNLFNNSGEADVLVERIYSAVALLSLDDQLARAGVDQEDIDQATDPPKFQINSTQVDTEGESDAQQGARFAIAYVFAFIAYMGVMLYGTWVAQGVVEEKSSRIMEIMINAATPRDLLFGKVLGIGMAAMTQLLPTIVLGGIVLALQRPLADRFDIARSSVMELDLGAISLESGGWFLIYFVFGFILFAALYAGIGSLVSRQEEVNQAVSPMTTIMIAGFFGAIFTMGAPDSTLARVLSIVPFTSPTTMVPRILLGDPKPWELALSLVLLIVTAVGSLMVAARIYRVGVLMYGQKPKLRAVFRTDAARVSR